MICRVLTQKQPPHLRQCLPRNNPEESALVTHSSSLAIGYYPTFTSSRTHSHTHTSSITHTPPLSITSTSCFIHTHTHILLLFYVQHIFSFLAMEMKNIYTYATTTTSCWGMMGAPLLFVSAHSIDLEEPSQIIYIQRPCHVYQRSPCISQKL